MQWPNFKQAMLASSDAATASLLPLFCLPVLVSYGPLAVLLGKLSHRCVLYTKIHRLLIVPHTGVRRPPRQQPRVRRRDEVRRQAAVLEAAEAVLEHFDEDVVHGAVVALS